VQVPSDRFQGVADANLVRKFGANATAVVYEDSAYGYGLAFNFIAGFTKGEGQGMREIGDDKPHMHRLPWVWGPVPAVYQHEP
jgi:ABC-type branched-subunit amino acid transport system substrate-binding protein